MSINKDLVDGAITATVKASLNLIPGAGSFFSEYLGLARELRLAKREEQWKQMVEQKLEQLSISPQQLVESEFFFSCLQSATEGAIKAYQEEKRQLFANTLLNAVKTDTHDDKAMLFYALLDRYTLEAIKLLHYFSVDTPDPSEKDYNTGGMVRTYRYGGTQHPVNIILEDNRDFAEDANYIQALVTQLVNDNLVYPIDFRVPVHPDVFRKKQTTQLGDEFLAFISA